MCDVAVAGALFTAAAGVAGAHVAHRDIVALGHGLTAALGILGIATLATAVALLFGDRGRAE